MDRSIRLLLLGAAVAFAVSAQADLKLVPTLEESIGDGSKFKQLSFFDGDKKVIYQPPAGWNYSGSETQLTLSPPKTQSRALVVRTSLASPGLFDDKSLEELVRAAVALVPEGSESTTVISQERNPLMIDGKETFLIKLSYTFYGQKYVRSILFLNRGNEQIRFQLTCREADFSELQAAFLRSHYTWQNL